MKEYAVISGTSILCVVKARDFKTASKKAKDCLAKEYKETNNVKILKVASQSKEEGTNHPRKVSGRLLSDISPA